MTARNHDPHLDLPRFLLYGKILPGFVLRGFHHMSPMDFKMFVDLLGTSPRNYMSSLGGLQYRPPTLRIEFMVGEEKVMLKYYPEPPQMAHFLVFSMHRLGVMMQHHRLLPIILRAPTHGWL